MDIVVDIGGEQFIVELKIWRGEQEHSRAYDQLAGYLESKGTARGYLLTFDFRKEKNRMRRAEWVQHGSVRIFDVVI
jgi:hypothetical protein